MNCARHVWLLVLALALGMLAGPLCAPGFAQDDEEDPLLDMDDDASDDEESGDEGDQDAADASEAAADETEEDAGEAEEGTETGNGSTRGLAFYIAAGLGAGSLEYRRPTFEPEMGQVGAHPQRLPSSPFAAADLELRLHASPDDGVSLEVRLAYQTSLGLVLQRPMLLALPQNINVRTQHVSLSAAPVVRLGDSVGDPALAFPIGFGYQGFNPEVDQYGIREYGVGGPFLRVELWLDLGEHVALRLGPEAQWLVIVDHALRRELVCCQGSAVGAQGSIEARLGTIFRLALAYRESHATVPGERFDFTNVERFLTARLAGAL